MLRQHRRRMTNISGRHGHSTTNYFKRYMETRCFYYPPRFFNAPNNNTLTLHFPFPTPPHPLHLLHTLLRLHYFRCFIHSHNILTKLKDRARRDSFKGKTGKVPTSTLAWWQKEHLFAQLPTDQWRHLSFANGFEARIGRRIWSR